MFQYDMQTFGSIYIPVFVTPLQNNEVGDSDVSVQPLAGDEDGEVKVAAAGPSAVQELSNEVIELASQSVDDVNLPSETVASHVCDVEPQAPCDAVETLHSEVTSESQENVAAAEYQAGPEIVCDDTFVAKDDDDDASHQRSDETVTSFTDEKLDSEDATVIGEDSGFGGGNVNTVSSEAEDQIESDSVDETDACDANMLVSDDQPRPADIVGNSAGSDVFLNPQTDGVSKVVSEHEERQDEVYTSSDLRHLSVLPKDIITLNTEAENVPTLTESGGGLVEDLQTHSRGAVAQLVDTSDVDATADTDIAGDSIVNELTEVSSQPTHPDTTPESVIADGLAECHVEDKLLEVCDVTEGRDVDATADTDIAGDSVVDELVEVSSQPAQPDTTPEFVVAECRVKDADKLLEVRDVTGGGDSVRTDEEMPDGNVSAEITAQLEQSDDKHEPVCSEVEHTEVISSADIDDVPVAESDSQPPVSTCIDAEAAAQLEHKDVEPVCSEADHADLVSAADTPIAESDNQSSVSLGIVAETAAQSDHVDIVRPAYDETVLTDMVSSASVDAAFVQTDNLPSISTDKSHDDVDSVLRDSVAGQEGTTVEPGRDEAFDTGDEWLDTVVNVSNVSFVNKDDVPDELCTDVSKEGQTDKVAVSAVVDGSSDGVSSTTAGEKINVETISVVDTDKAVSAADETAKETSGKKVAEGNTDTDKDKNDTGKAVTSENDVVIGEKMDTVDSCIDSREPVSKEVDSQQWPDMDVDGRTEKSRLYSKNVIKSIVPAAKDTSKAGTPPQQDMKVTGDQQVKNEPVVMRKKSPAESDSADTKQTETSEVQRVRIALL